MNRFGIPVFRLSLALLVSCGLLASAFASGQRLPESDFKPFPTYPREAALNCIEGYVDVRYEVGANGNPKNVEILYSTNPDIFNPPVLNIIYKWEIVDEPVGSVLQETIEFDLGVGGCDRSIGYLNHENRAPTNSLV